MFQFTLRIENVIEMLYLIVSLLQSVHRFTGVTSPIFVNVTHFIRSVTTTHIMRKFYLWSAFVTRC